MGAGHHYCNSTVCPGTNDRLIFASRTRVFYIFHFLLRVTKFTARLGPGFSFYRFIHAELTALSACVLFYFIFFVVILFLGMPQKMLLFIVVLFLRTQQNGKKLIILYSYFMYDNNVPNWFSFFCKSQCTRTINACVYFLCSRWLNWKTPEKCWFLFFYFFNNNVPPQVGVIMHFALPTQSYSDYCYTICSDFLMWKQRNAYPDHNNTERHFEIIHVMCRYTVRGN